MGRGGGKTEKGYKPKRREREKRRDQCDWNGKGKNEDEIGREGGGRRWGWKKEGKGTKKG